MNISELCHRESLISDQNLPGHCPTYIITESKQLWYFTSVNMKTLRKKLQNTSLKQFLKYNESQRDYKLFVIKLKVQNYDHFEIQSKHSKQLKHLQQLTDQKIVKKHFPINPQEKIVITRIDKVSQTKICSLKWSNQYIFCQEQINQHMKNKLTHFCSQLQHCIKNKLNSPDIQLFQLIFTHNISNNSIHCLFIQNIKIKNQQNKYFVSNFKVQRDDYQRIQVIQQKIVKKQEKDSEKYDLLKFKYLQFVNKVVKENFKKLPNLDEVQQNKKQAKEFQCTSCHHMISIQKVQYQRKIIRSHIPEIQYFRQVKMRQQLDINKKYDLVSVCQLCYSQFLKIVKKKQQNPKGRSNSTKHKETDTEMEDILKILSQKDRKKKINNFTQHSERSGKHYLNKESKKKNFVDTTVGSRKYSVNIDISIKQDDIKIPKKSKSIRTATPSSDKDNTEWSIKGALNQYQFDSNPRRRFNRKAKNLGKNSIF